MKRIVVLRHANESGPVIGTAKMGMIEDVAKQLVIMREGRIRLFCSTHPNAVQTAREFGTRLDAEPEQNDAVSKWNERPTEAFDALVGAANDADTAVIVTHKVDVAAVFGHLTQYHGFQLLGSGPFPIAPIQGYRANVLDREIQFVAHDV